MICNKGRNGKANNHMPLQYCSTTASLHWDVHKNDISIPSSPMTVTTNSLAVLACQKESFGDRRGAVVMETSELKCA